MSTRAKIENRFEERLSGKRTWISGGEGLADGQGQSFPKVASIFSEDLNFLRSITAMGRNR